MKRQVIMVTLYQIAARRSILRWSWDGWRLASAHKGHHHHVDHHPHHCHYHPLIAHDRQCFHRIIQIWRPHPVASYGHLHHNGGDWNLWKHSRLPRDSQVVRISFLYLRQIYQNI